MAYKEGYGVSVIPIWGYREPTDAERIENNLGEGDDWQENCDPDVIVDIDVEVIKLAPQFEVIKGNVLCVRSQKNNMYYPVGLFQELDDLWQDDTHDLRDRWFPTRAKADEYAEYVRKRFENPLPWESFVQL